MDGSSPSRAFKHVVICLNTLLNKQLTAGDLTETLMCHCIATFIRNQCSGRVFKPFRSGNGMFRTKYVNIMMTSSNGNIFRVTGLLCGKLIGEFPAQRPVTWSFDVFFDLGLHQQLSIQWRGRWFETPWHSLWRHCNVIYVCWCSDTLWPQAMYNHHTEYKIWQVLASLVLGMLTPWHGTSLWAWTSSLTNSRVASDLRRNDVHVISV